MRHLDIPPTATFKSKLRREPGTRHEPFSTTTVDGVYLKGAIGTGYLNGAYVYLLEFAGGGDEYRWVFDSPIPERSMDLIKAGIRHDPGYRDQFREPAVPAKVVDQDALVALLSRAFGEHTVESTGTIEPCPHSWESRLRIVLSEPLPASFASFVRKCPYLNISKVRRQDCITVTSALGNASSANLLFIKVIEDFASGNLGSQSDYKLETQKISTWPTKPAVISTKVKPISTNPIDEPVVTLPEKIQLVMNARNQDEKKRQLLFLKAGRDEFTVMKQSSVEERISQGDSSSICKHFLKLDDRLKAMRWVLRGLPAEDAIMKVDLDKESTTKLLERKKDYDRFDSDARSHSRH